MVKAVYIEAAPIAQRLAVCVYMPDTEEKSNTKLLSTVRTTIPDIYAIKIMCSRDIKIIVPN